MKDALSIDKERKIFISVLEEMKYVPLYFWISLSSIIIRDYFRKIHFCMSKWLNSI